MQKSKVFQADVLLGEKSQRVFKGDDLAQIAFPLGGLGTGSVSINGYGGLQDFSIRNKPRLSALPDGQNDHDAAFAILHIKGKSPVTKLVEGSLPSSKIYANGLKSQGFREGGYEGLPRFRESSFQGEFPFAYVNLKDPEVPMQVSIRAYNPFIPTDDKNSGIPCAILEYTFKNTSPQKIEFDFSYHLSHLAPGNSPDCEKSKNDAIENIGVFLYNAENGNDENFGSAALIALDQKPLIKSMWFRGSWFDAITKLWHEITHDSFVANRIPNTSDRKGRNGASLLFKMSLEPQEKKTVPVAISWYFPNSLFSNGHLSEMKPETPKSKSPSKCKTWYSTQWNDAKDVILYLRKNFSILREKTEKFHETLFSCSCPSYVLDAVSANLAILKSPSIFRQDSGAIWGWDGSLPNPGSSPSYSAHIWNYAQSLPHLFPALERTLREQEFLSLMDEKGAIPSRASISQGSTKHDIGSATDGQLGAILKTYREWQISGDDKWLKKIYPAMKKSMQYSIQHWDPKHKGLVEEPHLNTYEVELWGPEPMCSSIYIAALSAMAVMSEVCGQKIDSKKYVEMATKGAKYLDKSLFNGDYYFQKVEYRNLKNKEMVNRIEAIKKKGDSATTSEKLLLSEGPKYQYGNGCLSDGMLGAWMSSLFGLNIPLNKSNIRKHLGSVFQNNFRTSLWNHVNTQHPGFAIGDEPGLLVCSWPKGERPVLPLLYADDVFTGVEYQIASHLISEGMVDEGLTVVKAARSRYDGKTRNPWNEYECGSFSARAMSSYSLLQALSGLRYSRVESRLFVEPKTSGNAFTTLLTCSSGYGSFCVKNNKIIITMNEGSIVLKEIIFHWNKKIKHIQMSEIIPAGKTLEIPLGK